MIERLVNRNTLRSTPVIAIASFLGLTLSSCGEIPQYEEVQVCSPIVKLAQVNKPLTWGGRTLDEAAVDAKFRAIYLMQTQHGQEVGSKPIELSIEDGFSMEVGQDYCVTEQHEVPQKPAE